MVDAGGPSQPRPCNTVGLQNLGDVEGWDEEGEGLYLFELKDGVYVRAAMPSIPPAQPSIPPAPVRWIVDFRIQNPFIFVRRTQRVTKWQNSGALLASLIPRDPVKLRQINNIGYALGSQKKAARMQLIVEGPTPSRRATTIIPPEATLVCLVGLGNPPAKRLKLMTGVELEWDPSAKGTLVGVVIRTPGSGKDREPPYLTRKDDVRVTVGESINIEQIHLYTGLTIKRLMMVNGLPSLSAVQPYLIN